MANVVLGSQWGDEGKGKLVDILCNEIDVCCRCAGGNNAGHTIVVNNIKYDFHMLPSGLVNPNCLNLIGNGVVIHLKSLLLELNNLKEKGLKNCDERLFISSRAHLVFDFHQKLDNLNELHLSNDSTNANKKQTLKIGTTGKGIGPTYSTKASRSGIRVHHLISGLNSDAVDENEAWKEFESKYYRLLNSFYKIYGKFEYDPVEELARFKSYRSIINLMVVDSTHFVHTALADKKRILVEGANALMLDIDFGTYPYVTSSNTGIGGVITGLGIPPKAINNIYGVVKAYTTRVGEGPFPTEQLNDDGNKLQSIGAEFGVTTGRKRRCGWLDLVVLKYSTLINGYTSLNITKLDVLDTFKEIKVGIAYKIDGKTLDSFPDDLNLLEKVEVEYVTLDGWNQDITQIKSYDDLPQNAKSYLKYIETFLNVPIQWVGTGPSRDSMLYKPIN
ncbi:adenylosuccinate synthase [Ascoidea rubescens DSM 1968]|uniref:Adenylosuccinate synthetase n=1 Tax=Ascoidea rubescens DSM 1968 TaxID=1344418 RepID=A0A1D2VNQ7_9ASCO|nr:Adenylosuccinate synthetase (IMP--aspartate ligase) [Ascoidea rubescens DSM 1968]ODV63229.1 Adenylosuccinate synthetase (IMP--aspartate ligase) [Ascoidea rubescens DSM 1968]